MKALRYIVIIFTPIAVLTAAVAPLVVSVAFSRGAFSAAGEELTTQVVVGLAPIVLISMAAPVMTSALNAQRKGMILLAGGAMHLVVNVVADLALGLSLGIVGIALASSISAAVTAIFFANPTAPVESEVRTGCDPSGPGARARRGCLRGGRDRGRHLVPGDGARFLGRVARPDPRRNPADLSATRPSRGSWAFENLSS